jgi:hypothetical protein
VFTNDFRDYNYDDFAADYGSGLRLRNVLCYTGVYVRKTNGDVAIPLLEARDHFLQWPLQEARTATNEPGFFFKSPAVIDMLSNNMIAEEAKRLQATFNTQPGSGNNSFAGNKQASRASRHNSPSGGTTTGQCAREGQQPNLPMAPRPVYTPSDARSGALNTLQENINNLSILVH